jgi:hypothetical protein
MMTERAQELREIIRQALYRTPMTEECEVPITASALRYVADRLYTDWGELQHPASVIHDIANELEELK